MLAGVRDRTAAVDGCAMVSAGCSPVNPGQGGRMACAAHESQGGPQEGCSHLYGQEDRCVCGIGGGESCRGRHGEPEGRAGGDEHGGRKGLAVPGTRAAVSAALVVRRGAVRRESLRVIGFLCGHRGPHGIAPLHFQSLNSYPSSRVQDMLRWISAHTTTQLLSNGYPDHRCHLQPPRRRRPCRPRRARRPRPGRTQHLRRCRRPAGTGLITTQVPAPRGSGIRFEGCGRSGAGAGRGGVGAPDGVAGEHRDGGGQQPGECRGQEE